MRSCHSFISCALLPLLALSLSAQTKTVAERLGHPANSRLLIIHADDLAVAHSVDAASFDALDRRAVSSASIMMTDPWTAEVAAYARAHPDADLGLHLTLTSEWHTYRWGSVESRDKVPSLLDSAGTLWSATGQVARSARPDEVEREIRAQVERALAMGIRPTHLDSHMGSLFSTPALFATLVKVAHDYRLPFLSVRPTDERARLLFAIGARDVALDAVIGIGTDVPPAAWSDWYVKAIENLKPGLTELIVHLGHDDAELQAVTVDHPDFGSAWRQRDYDVMTSPAFAKALKDNHIVVVQWRDLMALQREHQ